MNRTPCFLVGAPRSGTKMLRDTLMAHPGIEASLHPLEEIWSQGQEHCPHHQFKVDSLTEEIKHSVREQFHERMPSDSLYVEKNVQHSLRIPYVRSVFPEARFIHILRDGRDVCVSLRKRWQVPIDFSYYLSDKGLRLPLSDIFYYSAKWGIQFIKRLIAGRDRVDTWGPRFPGIDRLARRESLLHVCAMQWKHCLAGIYADAKSLPDHQYFECRYEDLLDDAEPVLTDLTQFLDLRDASPMLEFAQREHHSRSVGRWQADLTSAEIEELDELIGDWLARLGYGETSSAEDASSAPSARRP